MIIIRFILLLFISLSINAFEINRWHTPKGAEVLFTQITDLPIVNIDVIFAAGSAYDKNKFGLASIVNDLFTTNTKHHNKEQIITKFKSLGAIFDVSLHTDMSILSLKTLSTKDKLLPAIKIFSEVIADVEFLSDELKYVKQQHLINIADNKQSPGSIVNSIFYQEIFKDHPYGHDIIGTADSISSININDVRGFYNKYYTAKNMHITIVGNISEQTAKQIARTISAKFNSGNKATLIGNTKKLMANKNIKQQFYSSQNHIMIGQAVNINRKHNDYYAFYLANHILGGSALHSLLGDSIREKEGLAYSVYSFFTKTTAGGYFAIKLQTKNNNSDKAVSIALKTLKDFNKKINNTILQDAKNNIKGIFALSTATNANIINYLSIIAFYNLPLNYINKFSDNIDKLTVEDVINIFNKTIVTDKLLTVIVGR